MTWTASPGDRPRRGLASTGGNAAAPAGARASPRPTETPTPGFEPLRDAEVADWLDRHPRAALFFWDETDPASQRQRARLEVVAAAAGCPVGALDVRTNVLVAQAVGVKSVPMLVIFRGGHETDRLIGAVPEAILDGALRGDPPHPAG